MLGWVGMVKVRPQGRPPKRLLAFYVAGLISLLFLTAALAAGPAEYRVKAAFVYKFLLFTDFSREPSEATARGLSICIWGEDPFGEAFAPVVGTTVKGSRLTVRRLGTTNDRERLGACQLLFVGAKNQDKEAKALLRIVRKLPVLTVGEHPDFLRWGGIVRVYEQRARVVFAINAANGKRVGIRFRSQMLRIAAQVHDGASKP